MLEIAIGALVIIAGVLWFRKRRPKADPAPKPADYICTHCGEKDCHCERRS